MVNELGIRVELLEKDMQKLSESIGFMKEEIAFFNKKIEFMQDNNAKLAVDLQAISEAVRLIINIADDVIEQKKKTNNHPSIQ